MVALSKRKVPRIVAIGGGKGGVGKSTVAANLALAIGRSGHRVALVDADLGAANLHTMLGASHPARTLADYIDHRVENLEEVMLQITPTVHLIPGTSRPGSANFAAAQKLRLVRAIARLEVECVVIDIGAGSSYAVIDLLAAADHKLFVLTPQLPSLHNAYALLKACVHRIVRKLSPDETHQALVDSALGHETRARTIPQLLDVIRPLDENLAQLIVETLGRLGVGMIGNQITNSGESYAMQRMSPLIHDHLMVHAPFVATVRRSMSLGGGLAAGASTIAKRGEDNYAEFTRLGETLITMDLAELRGEHRTTYGKTMPLWVQQGLEADAARERG